MEIQPMDSEILPQRSTPTWFRWRFLVIPGAFLLLILVAPWLWKQTLIPVPARGQFCGTIAYAEYPPPKASQVPAETQAIECFWSAYQHCRSATIEQGVAGTDAGWGVTTTLEPGNHSSNQSCQLYTVFDSVSNTDTKHFIFLCQSLVRGSVGLQIADCTGHAPYSLYLPQSFSLHCGTLTQTSPSLAIQDGYGCFQHASAFCYAAQLSIESSQNGVEQQRIFSINSSCLIDYREPRSSFTCSRARQEKDGLHMFSCGRTQQNLHDVFLSVDPNQWEKLI